MIKKINLENRDDATLLNSFLVEDSDTLLYVSIDYISLLQQYLNNSLVEMWVKTNNENAIVGYFPIVFCMNSTYGNVCNSLPFYGSNGGIVVSSKLDTETKNNVRAELLEKVLESINEKKCVAATFITNPLNNDFNEWIASNLSYQLTDKRIGQLTPLPQVSQEHLESSLMKLFEDPRPRNIRKALKENVTIYNSYSDEAFDFLYSTHFENITSINGIPKEKKFFDDLKNTVPKERYKIYIAEKEGEKIGALLLFYFNKTVEYFTPAIVEKHRNIQASALLIYKAMLEASTEGFLWWNWGGTWLSQGGVYDFKKKWGTQDFPYFYYTCVFDNSILTYSKDILLKEYPFFFVVPFDKLEK